MRAMRVAGIVFSVVVAAIGSMALPAIAQPSPPTAWLYDQSDRVINVAGCALACFDQVYSVSTPAYYSLNTPRSVTLVYNSRTAYPRPFVIVDAQAASTGVLPEKLSISLKVNGVPAQPLDGSAPIYYWYNDASRPVARLKFQFDGSGYRTGRYPVEVEIRAWSGVVASTPVLLNGYVMIVNELNSQFGAGWNIAGVQRLYIDGNGTDAVITEGDGSAVHFQRACWSCPWVAPDGEFSTLTNSDSPFPHYKRAYPDGSEVMYWSGGSVNDPASWTHLGTGLVRNYSNRFGAGLDQHWSDSNIHSTYFDWQGGRLEGITDPAGKKFVLVHSNGKLQSIMDPGSPARATQLTHTDGNLQRITLPGGLYEEFSYNVGAWERLMSASRSTSGHYTDYWYGYSRHLLVTVFPAVAIADSAGPVRPQFIQQPIANAVDGGIIEGWGTFASPASLMLAINGPYYHDARGNRTSFGTDRFGAFTSIGHWVPEVGDHNATWIYRNQHSQPDSIITPRGNNTQYFWTGVKLDSVWNKHSGQRIRYQYTSTYNDVQRIWGDIAEVRHFWHASGKRDSTRVGPQSTQSPRTRFTYDSRGRVVTAKQIGGIDSTVYVYGRANVWENLDTVKSGPRRMVYEYDNYGRLSAVRDFGSYIVQTAYDIQNRPIRQIGPNTEADFGYNEAQLRDSVIDAKGQIYKNTYNALGWLVSRTDPNNHFDEYAYDLNGNLARWTNRRGQTTAFTYDVLNRLTSRDAAGTVTNYATDIYDRFITTSNAASTDTIYFDIHGRDSLAVSVRWPSAFPYRTLSWYDIRGRRDLQNVVFPATAGSVTYGYDNSYDRLTSMSVPNGNTTFSYDSLGQLKSVMYPSLSAGVNQTYTFKGELASRTASSGPPSLLQQLYVRDDRGRAMQQHAPNSNAVRWFNYAGFRVYSLRDGRRDRAVRAGPILGQHLHF